LLHADIQNNICGGERWLAVNLLTTLLCFEHQFKFRPMGTQHAKDQSLFSTI
jgi:hypothetical protein